MNIEQSSVWTVVSRGPTETTAVPVTFADVLFQFFRELEIVLRLPGDTTSPVCILLWHRIVSALRSRCSCFGNRFRRVHEWGVARIAAFQYDSHQRRSLLDRCGAALQLAGNVYAGLAACKRISDELLMAVGKRVGLVSPAAPADRQASGEQMSLDDLRRRLESLRKFFRRAMFGHVPLSPLPGGCGDQPCAIGHI